MKVMKPLKNSSQIRITAVRLEDFTKENLALCRELGGEEMQCEICLSTVMAAPSSRKLLTENPGSKIWCMQCTTRELKEGDLVGISEEAAVELAALEAHLLGRNPQ